MSDPSDEETMFHAARAIPSGEARAAFLAQTCANDVALRLRMEALLKAYEQNQGFNLPDTALGEQPGTIIGRYKLLEKIGEGGFGSVFLAEQETPVRRKVALKIIKLGMDTKQVVARFEAERQALAVMDHPSVAKVFDGGATDSGRPYFVMELVRGIAITSYCDQNKLNTFERLKLFLTVCAAVGHAHQKGIIHRDIKPTNVLVGTEEGRPQAKVIDFGIARAVQARLAEESLFTESHQLVGTPEYMSPEQADGSLDVDTRSDVYSLGVLLYELLTASTPFDGRELRAKAYGEIQRIIREVEPPAPSTKLSTSQTLSSVAAMRNTEPAKLSAAVRGELDWIVMKALEKTKARRYESAASLAADIMRHLADEPVTAAAPSRAYRLRKFVRRNRGPVIALSTIIVVLIAGVIGTAIGLIGQSRQRAEAQRQAQIARTQAIRSEQVAKFLKDMLKAARPGIARGRSTVLLREILDQTTERVDKDLAGQPEVQGDLWTVLGKTYSDINDPPHAISSYQHAADDYRLAFGDHHIKLAGALSLLGHYQSFTNTDIPAGKANAALGLTVARKCDDPKTLVYCLEAMGSSFRGWDMPAYEAAPYLREAVAVRRKLGTDPVALADSIQMLTFCLYPEQAAEREALMKEVLDLHRKASPSGESQFASDFFTAGQDRLSEGKPQEAEPLLRKSLEMYNDPDSPNAPWQAIVRRFFIQSLAWQGKWDEAEKVVTDQLHVVPAHLEYRNMLVRLKACRGDWRAAIEESSRGLELKSDDVFLLLNRALVFLRFGDQERYRADCHRLLLIGDVGAPKISLMLPVSGADFQRACELSDAFVKRTDATGCLCREHLNEALAEYHRGRFAAANDWAGRVSPKVDAEIFFQAQARFIQAMAYARLGKTELARAELAKGEQLAKGRVDFLGGDYGGGIGEWTLAEMLHAQAAALITTNPPTTRP